MALTALACKGLAIKILQPFPAHLDHRFLRNLRQRKDLASRSFSFFHRAMGEGNLDGEGTGISVTSRVRVRYKQIIIVFWECRQPSARELRRGTFVSPLPRDRWNS